MRPSTRVEAQRIIALWCKSVGEQAIAALPREGFIGLQNYGGSPVWFRNIRIKPLTDRQPKFTGKENLEDVVIKVQRKDTP